MQFNEIIAKLTMCIPNYFSFNFASMIAEKLVDKPTLFHDWELDRHVNDKLVTYKFTISIGKINYVEINQQTSLFIENKTTGEAWII